MAKRAPKKEVPGPSHGPGASRLSLDASRPRQSRQDMIPGSTLSHAEKLCAARAVDLRDNAEFTSLLGGYLRVTPRDPTKRHG